MSRYLIIDGKRYAWRDILALYRAQRQPALPQPTLFELKRMHGRSHSAMRPGGTRNRRSLMEWHDERRENPGAE